MSDPKPLNLTDAEFESKVLRSATPVLVDFHADWCAPCRMLGPTIQELAEAYDGRVQVAKVDVEANPVVAGDLGVSAIPTVILFVDGKPYRRFVGITSRREFADVLDELAA